VNEANWPTLAAATHRRVPRLAFQLNGTAVGLVAVAHGPRLQELARACGVDFQVGEDCAQLHAPGAMQATAALQALNDALRRCGLIQGWRDELFPVLEPLTLRSLATMERAACRFWGTLTLGAHATGYVRGADGRAGRPSHLWIAQRSQRKATDPGLYDNLIGGGVPVGQTPLQCLLREGFEEAGLSPAQVRGVNALQSLQGLGTVPSTQAAAGLGPPAGSVLRVHRDVPHGLQHELLYCFDVELPTGLVPQNQDGEVAGFACMPVAQAMAVAASSRMTVDASLVTLDFLLRHRLLGTTAKSSPLKLALKRLERP
jgi:8-oxo-dGTP pyrophosphatase MutT (NUDIX family)